MDNPEKLATTLATSPKPKAHVTYCHKFMSVVHL